MSILNEIFKDIIGYKHYYQISNFGRVKSLRRYINIKNGFKRLLKERILKNVLSPYGYFYVELVKNKKGKKIFIHRLVAKTFINNYNNKPEVNHKNGIKNDNHFKNLEWVTHSENQKYAHLTGLKKNPKGELNNNSKLLNSDVIEIKRKLRNGNRFTCTKLAKEYNVHPYTIRLIRSNKRWNHIDKGKT